MVAYSFKKRFIKPIENGDKGQTIRLVGKKRHADVGDMLQLYYAQRTKHRRKIIPDLPCTESRSLFMRFEKGEIVNAEIDGSPVDCLDQFAVLDGFSDGISEMSQFWSENHDSGDYTGLTLPLVLVKWI